MQGKLLYIGSPGTAVEPIIQVVNGSKVILTSIRLAAPGSKAGDFSMYHLHNGETTLNTNEAIAFQFVVPNKGALEFLTHPLPVSPGESIWMSGDAVAIGVYGVTFP
jgi:hypothetical protein